MARNDVSVKKTARLNLDGKDYELPVIVGSEGEVGIDIQSLRGQTGAITFDPGYGNTGSCTQRDHLHRRRAGHPALPRLSDRAARRAAPASPRSPTC